MIFNIWVSVSVLIFFGPLFGSAFEALPPLVKHQRFDEVLPRIYLATQRFWHASQDGRAVSEAGNSVWWGPEKPGSNSAEINL